MARLAFIGDVMLGRMVDEAIRDKPPAAPWGDVLPILRDADAVFANLECAISARGRPWARTPKCFHFRADPAAVAVLRAANIRCVCLANNHVLDYEEPALLDTLGHLDAAGIGHAGAGRTLAEARAPAVIDCGGVRVAFLALTDNEPAFAARPNRPGVCYVDLTNSEAALDWLARSAAHARRGGAHIVVLSAHLGPNMVERPSAELRAFAHAAAERGVDLLHGHSAHVLQGVELCGRSCLLHDTGDFLDDYAVDRTLRNDWSCVFLVDADTDGLERLSLIPVRLGFARVDLATGRDFMDIRKRMTALSEEYGTAFETIDTGLTLEIGR